MVFPVFLASAVPSIFEFFVVDGFGEGILENKELFLFLKPLFW